ncbi:anthranilate synthase component II [Halobacillus yeomjeoni]|uniref:Aminodeoxychorismate/anthranilate synthase component II n=1 Tax=Halobacillus yeomjeoni TaxID=311194 RepID=A0A931HWE3_9BACI|nr:aminodeoxychorismate/anthranilate synthase component II [Halobacillus yeomjeoni]MBH0230411.1 aminodeoxychorismate/anthranilate synthase component II [Halobacillus yeomjeoni]
MIWIIDNYDSFTYNLVQYFKQIEDDVVVCQNDRTTIQEIETNHPDLIVLSPGPGNPQETGISREVINHFKGTIPILGICLGHQLIVDYFGGEVTKGERPMHGKVTPILHDGKTIFKDLPEKVGVTRYHSLQTPWKTLPEDLEVSARTEDGVVMAVRHVDLPIEGIQYHPESIMTDYGFEMLKNAYENALTYKTIQHHEVLV